MGRFGSKFALMMVLGGAFVLATATPAKAVPVFFIVFKDLTGAPATVSVFDGGAGDLSPGGLGVQDGIITVNNLAVGADFFVSASASTSNYNLGGAVTGAKLDMGVSDVTNNTAGAQILEVTTTATDYSLPVPPVTIKDNATLTVKTGSVSATAQSWVSDSNLPGVTPPLFPDDPAALENPTTLMTLGPTGSTSDNNVPESTDVASTPFSITNRATYTFSAGAVITSSGVSTEVNGVGVIPGPGGLALVLGGLPFLGASWLRRRGKQA